MPTAYRVTIKIYDKQFPKYFKNPLSLRKFILFQSHVHYVLRTWAKLHINWSPLTWKQAESLWIKPRSLARTVFQERMSAVASIYIEIKIFLIEYSKDILIFNPRRFEQDQTKASRKVIKSKLKAYFREISHIFQKIEFCIEIQYFLFNLENYWSDKILITSFYVYSFKNMQKIIMALKKAKKADFLHMALKSYKWAWKLQEITENYTRQRLWGIKSILLIKKGFVKALMAYMPIIQSVPFGRANQNLINQSYKFRYITLKTWFFFCILGKVLDKTNRRKA